MDQLFLAGDRRIDRGVVAWLLLATVLAGGLRLFKLEAGSFWLDELFTINASSQLSNMHNSKVLGYVPTLAGLHAAGIEPATIPESPATWRAMGLTERVARLPTAIVGILTVPLVGAASVRLLGGRGAILVAMLLAAAPWHIYWSQAARFYIPQFLFYTLAVIYYFVATRDNDRRCFVVAMACVLLAFLSQPTALIVLGVFATDWLVAQLRGQPLRLGAVEWMVGFATVMCCVGIVSYDVWAAPAQWTQFVDEGARHQSPARMLLGAGFLIGPVVVTCAGLTAGGLWACGHGRFAIYLTVAAILPLAVFAALSEWAFVGLRYAFVVLYAWLALTAVGIDALWRALRPRLGIAWAMMLPATVFASLGLSHYMYFNSGGNFHARWRDAAAYIRLHREDGERIRASDPHTAAYYMEEPVEMLPGSIEAVRSLTEPTWFVVEVTHTKPTSGRFWMLPDAELREVFPLRIVHGTSMVQVYKYVPKESKPSP